MKRRGVCQWNARVQCNRTWARSRRRRKIGWEPFRGLRKNKKGCKCSLKTAPATTCPRGDWVCIMKHKKEFPTRYILNTKEIFLKSGFGLAVVLQS